MTTFLLTLALAVCEAVIMAVLKKFIPILRGPLPQAPKADTREAQIQRNRFFLEAAFTYFGAMCVIVLFFTVAPYVVDIFSGDDGPLRAEGFNLQSARHIGPYLPDMIVPASLYAPATWRVAMIAVVPIMIGTGILFWPLWRLDRWLGRDSFEMLKGAHAVSCFLALVAAMAVMFYLFLPVDWGMAWVLVIPVAWFLSRLFLPDNVNQKTV